MSDKKKYLFILMIFVTLSMSACKESRDLSIERNASELTLPTYSGRAAGTKGNEMAADFLSEYMTELKIEPYNGDYYSIDFTMPDVVTNSYSELVINHKDGSVTGLVNGKDYFISFSEGNIEIELLSGNENWVIASDGIAFEELQKEKIKNDIVFIETVYFYNDTGVPKSTDPCKKIYIHPETTSLLQGESVSSISIKSDLFYEYEKIPNIVGIVKGYDSSKCVVLTAHFDHVGASMETYFPGAMDNSSGVASLLHIAENIKRLSLEKTFESDIVIAFTNSEEMLLMGSNILSHQLKKDYDDIYNINIDVLGIKQDEALCMGLTENSSVELNEKMRELMDKYEIKYNDEICGGDHMSFERNGIAAVTISSSEFIKSEFAHSSQDTIDKLDFSQIEKVSAMIIEFIQLNDGFVFMPETENNVVHQTILNSIPPGFSEFPKEIIEKFNKVVEEIYAGIDNGMDKDVLDCKELGLNPIYTYKDYIEIDPDVSSISQIGSYKLSLIRPDYTGYNTAYLYTPIYSQADSFKAVSINIEEKKSGLFSNNRHEESGRYVFLPIEGYDNYYAFKISNTESNFYYGFVYESAEFRIIVRLGNFDFSNDSISLSVWDTTITTEEMVKDYINELKVHDWMEKIPASY